MAYEMGTPEARAVAKLIRSRFLFRYGWPGSGWTRQVETRPAKGGEWDFFQPPFRCALLCSCSSCA